MSYNHADRKRCLQCGKDFRRGKRGATDWERQMCCGPSCAAKYGRLKHLQRLERAAVAK